MQEGYYYHIFNRGINRAEIFFEDDNYSFFLKRFDKYLGNLTDVYAYCLMPNHFHLLIKVKENGGISEVKLPKKGGSGVQNLTPVEKAFKDFFISYAKAINTRYNRTGALFQYKFKRKEVNREKYFIKLIKYIHMNPIKAGLCTTYEDWKYSSYNALVSEQQTNLNRGEVLACFEGRESFVLSHHQLKEDFDSLSEVLLD